MRTRIHHAFDTVEDAWRSLERSGICHGFQSYDWLANWHAAFGGKFQTRLHVAEVLDRSGDPAMILPLCVQREGGLDILTFLGKGVSDYYVPIMRQGLDISREGFLGAWEEIVAAAPRLDAVHIAQIPETVDGVRNPLLHLDCSKFCVDGHMAVLSGDWTAFYESRIPTKLRRNGRRQRKRLSELGEVRFVVAETEDEAIRLTGKMMEQKSRRYAETGVPNKFLKREYRDFYIGGAVAAGGFAHVSALMCGDVAVATHWGLVFKDKYYMLMPTYEGGDWEKHGCGRLLMEDILQWCIEHGCSVCDFTVGDEGFKSIWCDAEVPLYEHLEARSLKGRLLGLVHRAKECARCHPAVFEYLKRMKRKIILRSEARPAGPAAD